MGRPPAAFAQRPGLDDRRHRRRHSVGTGLHKYVSVYGDFNMAGHLLKIGSFFLIYKATVEAALKEPYEVLFRDLKQHELVFVGKRAALGHHPREHRRCGHRNGRVGRVRS